MPVASIPRLKAGTQRPEKSFSLYPLALCLFDIPHFSTYQYSKSIPSGVLPA
jgi:hypothetical protein